MFKESWQSFVDIANVISKVDPNALTRDDLGVAHFKEGKDLFDAIKLFYLKANAVDWSKIPPSFEVERHTDLARQILNAYIQIQEFDVGRSDLILRERGNMLQRLRESFSETFRVLVPLYAYHSMETVDFAAIKDRVEREAQKNIDSIAAIQTGIESKMGQINSILAEAKRVALRSGIAAQATHFGTVARGNFRASIGWAVIAGLIAAALLVYAFSISHPDPTKDGGAVPLLSDWQPWLRTVPPRLIIVAVLFTGLIFALRNFSARQHLHTVNRHRHVALLTFETFANGSQDTKVQDAVLLQATQSIFCAQPTGFLKGESEQQINNVTEVFRSGGQ